MRLDRLLIDHESCRDLGIRKTLSDQPQDLKLARREHIKTRGVGRGNRVEICPATKRRELADEAASDAGRKQRFAVRDNPNCLEQSFGGDVLEQKAASTSTQRFVDVFIEIEGGQDD